MPMGLAYNIVSQNCSTKHMLSMAAASNERLARQINR